MVVVVVAPSAPAKNKTGRATGGGPVCVMVRCVRPQAQESLATEQTGRKGAVCAVWRACAERAVIVISYCIVKGERSSSQHSDDEKHLGPGGLLHSPIPIFATSTQAILKATRQSYKVNYCF